jgi:DNA gyrase subunit B
MDGYIYAGVPPLYKITEKNGKNYKYLKNDNALLEYRNSHLGEKYEVNRLKGLGEMDDDEVAETLLDPDNRIIKQITVEDVQTANTLFENFMGAGVAFRKQFLKDHSEEANYNAE